MPETFPWVTEMAGVLETINQGVIINDDCGHVVFANRLFLKMIGIPEDELIGRTILDLYPPEDAAIVRSRIQQLRDVRLTLLILLRGAFPPLLEVFGTLQHKFQEFRHRGEKSQLSGLPRTEQRRQHGSSGLATDANACVG